MKLTFGFVAALASCVAAAQPSAEAFILSSRDSSTSTPSISRSLARLILLQRLAPIDQAPSTSDIPDGVDTERLVSLLNAYGKPIPPLFIDEQPEEPSQLVLLLEGLSEQQIKETTSKLSIKPSFTIYDPPSAAAHNKLINNDFYNVGVTNEHECSLTQLSNPLDAECWSGKAAAAKYNVQKNPETLTHLISSFPSLVGLAGIGEMDTTIVFLPSTSEGSGSQTWSNKPQELRKRQAEQVITSFGKPIAHAAPTTPSASEGGETSPKIPTGPIPACFDSLESCNAGTGSCSKRGECLNKFASPSGAGQGACFVCHCLSTKSGKDGRGVTHWAGPTCAKKDISVPFWLFAGFTLLLVGILTLAISMLYSVGEEKLPGVIGAGVSKSK